MSNLLTPVLFKIHLSFCGAQKEMFSIMFKLLFFKTTKYTVKLNECGSSPAPKSDKNG